MFELKEETGQMIAVTDVSKSFDQIKAADHISVTIKEGQVFGLIGTNGAGKSTTMRMMAGVIRPDEGSVTVDELDVYHHAKAKEKLFFIPDEPYFFRGATAHSMIQYYKSIYGRFDETMCRKYLDNFGLSDSRRVNTFSKGMKKQLIMLLGICANTEYLLCDETFDGLDPVMRQGIKSLLAQQMEERGLTTIIASHNLRELEDICDHVGLLHRGGVLLSKDLLEMKCNIQKIQCVFQTETDALVGLQNLNIVQKDKRGSLYTLTVRGKKEEIIAHFSKINTVFFEVLPLSLEEIFISETEVAGYDVKKLIFG